MPSRIALCLALALPVTALLACGDGAANKAGPPPQVPLVEAVEVRFGALPIEESMPGVVRARNQVEIRPETEGRIVAVPARIGDAVERGRLLVRLADSETRERLRQAEADVRLAEAGTVAARARVAEIEARVARSRALAAQQLVSAQDMETLEAQLDATRANADEAAARVEQRQAVVEESRSALAKTEVRAPVAGRLGERRAEVGMRVDPSSVLFVVGDLDELIVEVNLTEAMLSRVEEGLPVMIEAGEATGESGAPIRTELSRISPFLAEESFTTVGEIDVDNPPAQNAQDGPTGSTGTNGPTGRLRPGMFVTVRILIGESRQAALVPVSALFEDQASGATGVFVVEDTEGLVSPVGVSTANPEKARPVAFRRVEVLAQGPGAAGVTGIEKGAWVVVLGQQMLSAEARTAAANAAATEPGASPAPQIAARVRPVSWERVAQLQDLQDEDLLEGFLDKQRKVAAAIGAEIPASEDVVDRVLEEAASGSQKPAGP